MDNILSTYDDDEVTFIMCDVCKTKIRDSIYKIHLTTSQHLKKEEALIAAGKLRRERPLPVWTSYTDYLDYLQLDEPIVGLKHVVEVDAPPDSLGPRYMCRLCRFDGDMPEMTNHIIARKHRQKYLETHRPDLVTWKNNNPQPGRVVRAKAGMAERQDGRGVPKESKRRPAAIGSLGAPRVLSAQWRGGQTGRLAPRPNQPQLHQQEPAHHRDRLPGWDYPREESYGRGFPESPPHIFASGEELRAEKPRRGSQELVGGFYPQGHAQELPVDSYHAYRYGDRMHPERADYKEERRGVAYEEEPIMGGAYEDEVGRGRDYAGAGKRGRSYDREGMSGVYEREERRGRAYEEDERWGGAHEGDGFRGEAYAAEAVRSGVYEGKGIRGGAYSSAEPGRYMRVSSGHRSTGSSEREVGGAERQRESPVREWPTTVSELPETFMRFLSGAAEKRRPSHFSQDREPSMAEGLDSKKLKLDPLIFGKKKSDMERVEEASFNREQLCNLLKEFQANQSQMEWARRKSPSERGQRDPQDHSEWGQRDPQDDFDRGQRDSRDHFKRGQRDPPDNYERRKIDPKNHFKMDQRDSQDRFVRDQRDPPDYYERGQRDPQNPFKMGRRDSQDRFVRDQRDPPDYYERGQRDPTDHYESGPRDPQNHIERGQRDSHDRFKRGRQASQDHYEEYGRVQEDPIPRGSHERSDPRAMHPDSYEGVWSPQQRLDRMKPPAEFDPHPALPPARMPQGYSSPENSASLKKITSALLQLVANRRPY